MMSSDLNRCRASTSDASPASAVPKLVSCHLSLHSYYLTISKPNQLQSSPHDDPYGEIGEYGDGRDHEHAHEPVTAGLGPVAFGKDAYRVPVSMGPHLHVSKGIHASRAHAVTATGDVTDASTH